MLIKFKIKKIFIFFIIMFLSFNSFFNFNIYGYNNPVDKKNKNNEIYPIFFEEIILSKKSKIYRASGLSYNIMLRKNEALLFFVNKENESQENTLRKRHATTVGAFSPVYFRFINANNSTTIIGKDKIVKKLNYYNSEQKEVTKYVNLYKEVNYIDIYPGVNLTFSGDKNSFNYILYIDSKSDINNILLEIDGVQNLSLDAENNMIFEISGENIVQAPPKVFIIDKNKKIEKKCNFYIKDKNLVGLILN